MGKRGRKSRFKTNKIEEDYQVVENFIQPWIQVVQGEDGEMLHVVQGEDGQMHVVQAGVYILDKYQVKHRCRDPNLIQSQTHSTPLSVEILRFFGGGSAQPNPAV